MTRSAWPSAPGIDRVGAFMVGNGGWWLNEDGTEVTARLAPRCRRAGVRAGQLEAGHFAMSSDLDAGWGGEAFGTGKAAMTIEGNWIKGAMTNDYPDVDYTVTVELPEGPAGKGTLQFTQCWGIAAESDAQDAGGRARRLPDHRRAAAGVRRGLRRDAVPPERRATATSRSSPTTAAFVAGGDYGHGPISAPGHGPGDRRPQLQARGLQGRRPRSRWSSVRHQRRRGAGPVTVT